MRLQSHAEALGGQCLSTEYLNNRTKMQWRCQEGHGWLASPHSILIQGSWCAECAHSRFRLGLQRLKDHAESLGGQCLATSYTNSRSKVAWRCCLGHEWQAAPDNVLHRKSWCPTCAQESRRGQASSRRILTLQHLTEHASRLGGSCLASEYVNSKAKVLWQCRNGHKWAASTSSVLHANSWCIQCTAKGPLGLKLLQDHAAALGGLCLATEYRNSACKVLWRCKHGHEWQATPKKVLRAGTWCPHCAKRAPDGLRRVQAHAVSLGGQCLTTSYQNSVRKLEWMCRFGHKWSASAHSVLIKRTWCPKCAATTWRTESEVRCVFEAIFFPAEFQSCFPDFLDGLQLDGYCPDLRLAFEYQGKQHYDPNSFFHSRDPTSFRKQQERDAAKAKRCQQTGVRLVIVPYFVRDKRLHVQLALLQWFSLAEVNPIMLEGMHGHKCEVPLRKTQQEKSPLCESGGLSSQLPIPLQNAQG